MPGVFPDYPAPVIRNTDAGADALGHAATSSRRRPAGYEHPQHDIAHWRGWLKPESRCLANSFRRIRPRTEPETKKKDVVWFAPNDDRPLTAFARIWTRFNGDRGTKSKPIPDRIRSTVF